MTKKATTKKVNRSKKSIKMWCFQHKDTGILEPWEGSNILYGYGIYPTKKELLSQVWNEVPDGFKPVRIELIYPKI